MRDNPRNAVLQVRDNPRNAVLQVRDNHGNAVIDEKFASGKVSHAVGPELTLVSLPLSYYLLKTGHVILQFLSFDWFIGHGI